MHEKLIRFVDHARENGWDHASIFMFLLSSEWKEKQIAEALAARELELPIPERPGIGSAREAFLHLLAFTSLYASAISLVLLFFWFIQFWFPDPALSLSPELRVLPAVGDNNSGYVLTSRPDCQTRSQGPRKDGLRPEGACRHETCYRARCHPHHIPGAAGGMSGCQPI